MYTVKTQPAIYGVPRYFNSVAQLLSVTILPRCLPGGYFPSEVWQVTCLQTGWLDFSHAPY